MVFFMRTVVTFDEKSVADVSRAFPSKEPIPSSKLLQRQLKSLMHMLCREQVKVTLSVFDEYSEKQSVALWSVCFCVMLILCLCIEDIQLALDHFIPHERQMFGRERPSFHPCSESEVPYYHLTTYHTNVICRCVALKAKLTRLLISSIAVKSRRD
jgi:hypothetical protein